jgi:hypothetical protein
MKKFLIFALLILPMTSFGASSVRVLGSGTATPAAGLAGAAKVTPAKVTAAKPAAASTASTAATSRIGTIRVKPKATTNTLSAGTSPSTSTGSRFPVITPAHSYKTVTSQQAGATNTGTGTGTAQPASVTDDPRFDMIHVNSREDYWRDNYPALTNTREREGYVFMWVEE